MDTIERIKQQTDSLIMANENLIDILAKAGQDSETPYTKRYLDLLEDVKAMREALHKLLWEDHLDTWKEVDYAAGGFMPTRPIPNQHLPPENETKKGKIDIRNLTIDDVTEWVGAGK